MYKRFKNIWKFYYLAPLNVSYFFIESSQCMDGEFFGAYYNLFILQWKIIWKLKDYRGITKWFFY